MELSGKYLAIAEYFNEHTDYEINEKNCDECSTDYYRKFRTRYYVVSASEGDLSMVAQLNECELWGEEGTWMICTVYDKKEKKYLVSTRERVEYED